MRAGAVGGLLVVAACGLGLITEAVALAGGDVAVRGSSFGGVVVTVALILLAGGASILGLSGPRPLAGRLVRVGLVGFGLGIATVIATTDVPSSSMLVVVYLVGGLIAGIGAVCIALALLRSTGEPRRITIVFLAGLLLAAVGGGIANGATSDNALFSRLAEILPTPIVLVGSWVMLAAVARFGLLGIREPEGR